MSNSDWMNGLFTALISCAVATGGVQAQTFNTLVNFDISNEAFPTVAPLVQGLDGNLYGTTTGGGATIYGTVYKITPSGTLTTLHSFRRSDGAEPHGALVEGTDGDFYGTTLEGGTQGGGTIEVNPWSETAS